MRSVSSTSGLRGAFNPNGVYSAGDLVTYSNTLYAAKVSFTAGAAFVPANWTAVIQGQGLLAISICTIDSNNLPASPGALIPNFAAITFEVIQQVVVRLILPQVQVAAATDLVSLAITETVPSFGVAVGTVNYFPGTAFGQDSQYIEARMSTPGTYTVAPTYGLVGPGNVSIRGAAPLAGMVLSAHSEAV